MFPFYMRRRVCTLNPAWEKERATPERHTMPPLLHLPLNPYLAKVLWDKCRLCCRMEIKDQSGVRVLYWSEKHREGNVFRPPFRSFRLVMWHSGWALSVLLWKGEAKPARGFAQLEQDWFVDIPPFTDQMRLKAAANIKGARSVSQPGTCLHWNRGVNEGCSFVWEWTGCACGAT